MRAIVPTQAAAVTRKGSERVEQALAVVSGRSVSDTLGGIAATLTTAVAEQSAAWPFWKTEPCPAWCDGGHEDGDDREDRNHWFLSGGQPIELSLHDPWYVPGYPAAANVTGRDIPAAFGPQHLDVAVVQHYRASAPDVLLSVPRFDQDDRADGEMEVRLTTAEAAALRDRLTVVLAAVDASAQAQR